MVLDQVAQAAVLGILQGLTELLPISSSAHLILLPWLFNWEHLGLTFDVVIHSGTLLAILIYFNKDWRDITSTLFRRIRGNSESNDSTLDLAVLLGTLPAIVVALACRSLVEDYARSPAVIVVTLSLFGILLGLADRYSKGGRSFKNISPKLGLLIGIAQALALIPGVSRSGVTIMAGLYLGFSRTDSARFSFLLSGPIITLATLNGLFELNGAVESSALSGWSLLAGVATSFLTGLLCIKYFLRFLKTKTLMPFVVYRVVLAAIIALLLFLY